MSLQFHDITRQQIQHVQSVLESIETKLREGTPLDRLASLMVTPWSSRRRRSPSPGDEFDAAVTTVIEGLTALADDESAIISQIGQVAWAWTPRGSLPCRPSRTASKR